MDPRLIAGSHKHNPSPMYPAGPGRFGSPAALSL
ncbi:hypothetical protein EMIT0347P_160026 [Pseudomonas sp. IT-347P]